MFSIDRFVEDCRAAMASDRSHQTLREVVAHAVSEPHQIIQELGEPTKAGLNKLHHSPDLTVLNLVWGPFMTLSPHDHNMSAVIGIYSGREDNIFWRRCDDGRIEAAGAKAISERETVTLGRDIVHSVTNPIPRFTAALHVYAGDFFNAPRIQWDAESLEPAAFSAERAMRFFEEWNGLIQPERLAGISVLADHSSRPN